MVKKIRVIDDTPEEAPIGGDRDFMEMAKTMDWKLWEILQIMQRLEKAFKNGTEVPMPAMEDYEEDQPTTKTKSTTKKK